MQVQDAAFLLPRHPRKRRNAGFALVVALALLTVMLLLVTTLATMTAVETSLTSNARAVQKARANAMLGFKDALGRIQELAGPDRRASAAASMLFDNQADADAADKQHWVGVWDSASWDPQDPASRDFLGWLVSAPDNARDEEADADTPYAGGTPRVRLARDLNDDPPEAIVEAPLVDVPGGEGAFAWWAADESLKARINLDDPYQRDNARTATALEEKVRFFLPQTFGLEALDALSGVDVWTGQRWGQWDRLIERDSLRVASGFTGLAPLLDNTGGAFHHFTTTSQGVLADSQRGGLRKNLSWALFDDTTFGSTLADSRIVETDDISGPYIASDFYTARWEVLRDYFLLPDRLSGLRNSNPGISTDPPAGRAGGALEAGDTDSYYRFGQNAPDKDGLANVAARLTPGDTDDAIEPTLNAPGPVIARIGFFYRVSAENNPAAAPGDYLVYLEIIPRVTIWNPYNVPLRLDENSQLNFRLRAKPFISLKVNNGTDIGGTTDSMLADATGQNLRDRFEFRVSPSSLADEDRTLAPGELRAFGLRNSLDAGNIGTGGSNQVIQELQPYLDADASIRFERTVPTNTSVQASDRLFMSWNPFSAYHPGGNQFADLFFRMGSGGNQYQMQQVDNFKLVPFSSVPEQWAFVGILANNLASVRAELGGYDIRLRHAAEDPGEGVAVLANYNPRAFHMSGVMSDFDGGMQPANWDIGITALEPFYSDTVSTPNGELLRDNWGSSIETFGQENVALYDLPRDYPVSLGEFAHAHTSFYGNQPAHPIGNSYANPHLDRELVTGESGGYTQVDLSWLLNNALWDRYFLSSQELGSTTGDIDRLPNPRLKLRTAPMPRSGLQSFDEAAERLTIDGPFNVNSTSVEAWKALLASLDDPDIRAFNLNTGTGSDLPSLENPLFRFSRPLEGTQEDEWYRGYYELGENTPADDPLDELARQIVEEVRERGPFLNLSDFVNRRLTGDASGRAGALQAAIDDAGINSDFISDYALEPANANFPFPPNAPDNQGAGMTGYLTQADLLNALGPVITTRGDTFEVRTYGEYRDPLTNEVVSKAWIRATVQRVPDEVVETAALPAPANTYENASRKFQVVSFRWLDEDEL